MRTIRYLDAARAEFLHEVAYFGGVSDRLAEAFDNAVRAAELRAAERPEAGSAYQHGTRRVFPKKFPFSLVYVTRPDEVVVIALAPFKRKPGYWKRRLRDS